MKRTFVTETTKPHITCERPQIDETRGTANYVRQSGKNADTAHGESRETQLELYKYSEGLYVTLAAKAGMYDEGAGVSGRKRIDQRPELTRLYRDIASGLIGTIVVAREDRLFRDKHLEEVAKFTQLAERMKIKLIVPPIATNAKEANTIVYDFTKYEDLDAFQTKMKDAYKYIETQVKHMHRCLENKRQKGGYDGRVLPAGLVVDKKTGEIVVYKPWADIMENTVYPRAKSLGWDMTKLNREIDNMEYLFPEIPETDKERYTFKTTLHHVKGKGYKPTAIITVTNWLTNIMYLGWYQPHKDQPLTFTNHHAAIIDETLFAEGYERLTGFTLDGDPVDLPKSGKQRIQKKRETPPNALFHGRLLATPPTEDTTAFTSVTNEGPRVVYRGECSKKGTMTGLNKERFLQLDGYLFDTIIVNRLRELADRDSEVKEKVRGSIDQIASSQQDELADIETQLQKIEKQIKSNAKKRLITDEEDELYELLVEQSKELDLDKKRLLLKKERLGDIDTKEELERFYGLLENWDEKYPKLKLEDKQNLFNLLVKEIEVGMVTPHWVRVRVEWLDAILSRTDIALIWRNNPTISFGISDEEESIIKQQYASVTTRLELMQLVPNRSWSTIKQTAQKAGIKRTKRMYDAVPDNVCYQDFFLGDEYMFGEQTLDVIKQVDGQTDRFKNTLCPVWLFDGNPQEIHQHIAKLACAI